MSRSSLWAPWARRRIGPPAGALGMLGLLLGGAPASAGPKAHAVTIRNFQYSPDTLRVGADDTVVWTNQDAVPHTATAADSTDDSTWNSATIPPKASWTLVTGEKGTHAYGCAFHLTMTAVLIVQ